MADDAFIFEKAIDVALGEARYPVEIEIMERCTEVLTLDENGSGVVTQPRRNFRRSSVIDGAISRISAFTTFSTTNGSSFTLL